MTPRKKISTPKVPAEFQFLVPFLVLIGLWYFVYEVYIIPSKVYNSMIIEKIARLSYSVLNFIGESVFISEFYKTGYMDHVGIVDSPGVLIGTGCDGLVIMALFLFFVICFPGKILNKIWFIPSGLLLIYLVNVGRVVILALFMAYSPEWLSFNHDYTFTVLTYAFVFLLWYIWVKFYSK